jgi:hypothetical protein
MEIPDSYVGWIIGIFSAMVAWLVRLEARLNARPTRKEQEVIAEKVKREIDLKFDEIKRMLEKQNESSARDRQTTSDHRQWVGDSLADIRTKVAVMRDRLGDDSLLEETGTHRRRP